MEQIISIPITPPDQDALVPQVGFALEQLRELDSRRAFGTLIVLMPSEMPFSVTAAASICLGGGVAFLWRYWRTLLGVLSLLQASFLCFLSLGSPEELRDLSENSNSVMVPPRSRPSFLPLACHSTLTRGLSPSRSSPTTASSASLRPRICSCRSVTAVSLSCKKRTCPPGLSRSCGRACGSRSST